jgi:hypothetical protein
MRIGTATSEASTARKAIDDIHAALSAIDRRDPDFIAIHFGVGTAASDLQAQARLRFPSAAIHGGSSCLGVMTDQALVISSGGAVGAFAIWDTDGSYGTAAADLGTDAAASAENAARAALLAADRPGETPDFVWLTVAPGREEEALEGLRRVVGSGTPILGGSAADNDISGAWAQFGPDSVHADGVVVSVMFPGGVIGTAYGSGYAPTGKSGIVTRADRRRVFEIDGRATAEVYREWTGDAIPAPSTTASPILAEATYWPLGRVTRHVAGVPFHLLAHPATMNPDGSLDLFANVQEGDTLWQMHGSAESLVTRAPQIARQSLQKAGGTAAGALIVYCGGCMLAVRERMEDIRKSVNAELGGAPWVGVFTFGEQGAPPDEPVKHGNLMISCTVISED